MKYAIILAAVIDLSGCFYQTVNNYDINAAVKICEGLDKVAVISADFTGDEQVTCTNAHQQRLHLRR